MITVESNLRHNLREAGKGHNYWRFLGKLSWARVYDASANGAAARALLTRVARAAVWANRATASSVVWVRLSLQVVDDIRTATERRPITFWASTTLPTSACILVFSARS